MENSRKSRPAAGSFGSFGNRSELNTRGTSARSASPGSKYFSPSAEPGWRFPRLVAWLFDISFLLIPLSFINAALERLVLNHSAELGSLPALEGLEGLAIQSLSLSTLLPRIVSLLLSVIFFAIFERSPLRATPGKSLLGLMVADTSGAALTFKQALLRNLARHSGFLGSFLAAGILLSGARHSLLIAAVVLLASLLVGLWTYASFLFDPSARGLHDRVSGALVQQRKPAGFSMVVFALIASAVFCVSSAVLLQTAREHFGLGSSKLIDVSKTEIQEQLALVQGHAPQIAASSSSSAGNKRNDLASQTSNTKKSLKSSVSAASSSSNSAAAPRLNLSAQVGETTSSPGYAYAFEGRSSSLIVVYFSRLELKANDLSILEKRRPSDTTAPPVGVDASFQARFPDSAIQACDLRRALSFEIAFFSQPNGSFSLPAGTPNLSLTRIGGFHPNGELAELSCETIDGQRLITGLLHGTANLTRGQFKTTAGWLFPFTLELRKGAF